MPPLRPSDGLPPTREAAHLGAFARGLGCGVGIERSCKLSPGTAAGQRFLLSFGADARTARLTRGLLADLEAPEAVRSGFERAASGACFLHLGYEGGLRPVLKVYCEGDPDVEGQPLYTAWKWTAGGSGAVAVDDYRLSDATPGAALDDALGLDALAEPCRRLLAKARDVLLLEVRRRGSARRSYDARLYDGELTMGEAEPVIRAAAAAFALDDAALEPLRQAGGRTLGHLAGGRDDGGAPFLTLYYGAEAFA